MTAAAGAAASRLRAYFDAHGTALDVALAGAVTLVAALLRLVRLGDIPYGVHPDEAQIGLDAIRVTHEGWIGVYSHAALGIPTLNDYITTPGIWLLGRTAFALRIDLALVGLAAVPLLYALVRVAYARAEAFFASLLLAVSYWHLLYSRVAHMSISYPTLLLGALLCIMLGLKGGGRAERAWFAGAGVLLGLSIYAYNVGAIAIAAVAAFLAVMTLTRYRARDAFRRWWPSPAFCLGVTLLVALPFLWYISDPHAYFWAHIGTYRDVGVTRTAEYHDASLGGKVRIIADQIRDFAGTYAWHGKTDYVDASGQRPIFDPLTLALLAAGLVMAVRARREPMVIAAACCIAVVPLPAVLQQGSMMREPLGAAPFVMFIAALPLAAVWRAATRMRAGVGATACMAAALAPALVVGATTIHDYFWTWRQSALTRYVYHEEVTAASEYMKTLSPGTYIMFYSDRHPLTLETRVFIAPDVRGQDRSREFSGAEASIGIGQRTGRIAFVLLGTYLPLLPEIERRYPGGVEHTGVHNGRVDYYAYEVGSSQ